MADKSRRGESEGNPAASARPAAEDGQRIELDDSDVVAMYANVCRVASTPEEVIVDLGLSQNPTAPSDKIRISQRVILSHYTAKRLLALLAATVHRHEQVFGVVETDIRKRVKAT